MLKEMLLCINTYIALESASRLLAIEMLLDVTIFGFSFCDLRRRANREEKRKTYLIVQTMHTVRQVAKSYWFHHINLFASKRLERS